MSGMLSRDGHSGSLRVRHVRLRGFADAVRARQRFESAVSAVDASSLGLPSHALLIVRRLVPGAPLPLERANHSTAFQRAVSAELGRCAQSARRPWVHTDTAAADGVWFADDTELVACLVRDWLRGAVHEGWWWPAVLSGVAVTTWLKMHVLSRGEVFVPALARAAAVRAATGWVGRLDDSEATSALDAVARAYDVRHIRPHDVGEVARNERDASPPHSAALLDSRAHGSALARSSADLLAIVPELQQEHLHPSQARLLAWALVATRASAWLRTESFAITVESWIAAAYTRRGISSPTAIMRDAPPAAEPRDDERISPPARPTPNILAAPAPTIATARRTAVIEAARDDATSSTTTDRDARLIPRRSPRTVSILSPLDTPTPGMLAPERGLARDAHVDVATNQPAGAAFTHADMHVAELDVDDRIVVDTQFGGIFYLLNAAIALELYGDFTTPRSPGIALSPWDLLALAGRAWFGAAFVRDPVWDVLASLAGRMSDDEPGHDFVAPPSSDVPMLGAVVARPRTRTKRWIIALIAYLHARLARAVGKTRPSAMRSLVCRHDARVIVTTAAVDLHLTLAHLPLPIRFAGLDRDPGWIPAAGRNVAFHFA